MIISRTVARISVGYLGILALACQPNSDAARTGRNANGQPGAADTAIVSSKAERFVYGRSQRDSVTTLGWLIRLGPGEGGVIFYGDRPMKICSLRQSNGELAFVTATDFGRSLSFNGKMMAHGLVGELQRIGPGAQTDSLGTTRLMGIDTGRVSASLLSDRPGFYSNLYVDDQTGDPLGSELILFVAGGERVALFQQAEGSRSLFEQGLHLQTSGDTVTFSLGEGSDSRHLSAVLQRNIALLRDLDSTGRAVGAPDTLPLKHSIKELLTQSGEGTCSTGR
jgi:hypothetical protein